MKNKFKEIKKDTKKMRVNFMDFFNLEHGYNNTQLKQAYLSKLDTLSKLDLSELEKEILMNETDRLYNEGLSHLSSRNRTVRREERPLSVFRPLSSLDYLTRMGVDMWMNDFHTIQSQFDSLFQQVNNSLKHIKGNSSYSSSSVEYREKMNEDGSRVVYESKDIHQNGEVNKVTNSYSISKEGTKIPITVEDAFKAFGIQPEIKKIE